ncbi:unnamed protein product [Symbiodinium sp. CCMP2592]|nr:unnamed protein product [Symbiodinium sp. CCMP2592]
MIRKLTAEVNRTMTVKFPLERRLAIYGFVKGTAHSELVDIDEADVLLLCQEGPLGCFYYYYPFASEEMAQRVMDDWRWKVFPRSLVRVVSLQEGTLQQMRISRGLWWISDLEHRLGPLLET